MSAPQPSAIKTSGGDYTSLTAWASNIPANLTGLGEFRAVLYIAGLTQTGGLPFTGFTTTATDKIVIDGSGLPHTGVAHSGAYIQGTLGVIRTQVDYFELQNLEIHDTDGSGAVQLQRAGGTNSTKLLRCILHGSNGLGAAANGSTNYIFRNCIIYASGAARTYDARGAGTLEMSNSIIYTQAGDFPFLTDAGHVVKNTYVGGASNQNFWSGGTSTGNNNAASDTTATAQFSSSINSIAGSTAFTSVTSGSENFTTKTGFTGLTDLGATLAAVTDDIIGTSRPQGSAYDIGAFENISGGGAIKIMRMPCLGVG
jgi:hypothetical protein